MPRTRTTGAVLLLAALALATAAVLLWPYEPPLFEDEILPLVIKKDNRREPKW